MVKKFYANTSLNKFAKNLEPGKNPKSYSKWGSSQGFS